MARIKKYSPLQNLSSFQTFITDENPNSDYFRITEFKDTFTGGKNGFLIEGSEHLKESTEIKVEILDVNGDPIYYEPGNGIPEYYEGISKLIAVYIYNDTPIGLGKITVLGELKQYDDNGVIREIPDQWKGSYNVKWERTFQINKNISNEDRVRFYKRPKVTIDEINKPIFSNNSRLVTKTGTVDGIPLVPVENTNLSNFSLPTSYRLKVKTGDNWTGSIEGDPITFDNIDYNPIVEEVVNKTEIIVTPPYSEGGLVKSFTDENYSLTFPYLEGINDLATALTGSFAKIKITDMKTFVGDAARVKIFRRSQSNVTDFEFVQEIQLESNELLRDIETFAAPEELYGFFTEPIIEEYWVTSSNDLTVSFNQDFLYNSAKLNSSGNNLFFTTRSLDIENDIEYSLDFNVRKGSLVAGEKITAFLSGSLNNVAKSQTIIEIPSSNGVLQKTNYNENFIADEFDEAKLYFDVNGSDWYINNLSLKASQETSFSPDVITFIQNVPKTLAVETFDYRFEFYDINNNFIPVLVEATKRFDGGNLNLFEKSIEITPSNLYFTFDSASLPANPLPPTSIIFDIETSLITGSISFTSGAYDEFGNFLSASEYAGGQYPGLLRNIDSRTPVLNVADFTGSRSDIAVQYIRFTGFAEGVSDEVVITRVQDGKGGVNFEIVPFRGTSIKNKSDKDLEIQAYRIDGINRIELKDNLPQTGFSDAKLRVLSSSIDPITSNVSSSYFLLSEAQSNGFIRGLQAGTTGSGEIDYNATFNRDSIENELTVYLMDGPTSESILTSIILNDLQDGLASGFISFDAEQFGIKPRDERVFTPEIGRVTGSFYLRGTNTSPISGTLDIYPSMSVDPDTKEPFYYMFYVTDSFDRRIDIVVTDKDNNIVDSGRPGEEVPYFVPTERKQLTTTFTYTEDITSASISVDKTFFSVPDGLPGADSIIVDIDPRPVVLNADQRGNVFNYSNADTTITVTQGRLPLIFNDTKKPGTFTTSSITALGIEYTTFDEVLGDATMSLSGFQRMTDLTASVTYDLEIHPYFTGSFYTQSFVQQFKKTLEGADAINIELDPTNVQLNAEENGGVADFSAANTTLRVKQGDTYMEFSTSSLVLPGTFSASLSPNQISIGTFSSSNDNSTERNLDDTLHFRDFNNFLKDSGSVDYQITVYPFSVTNGILSGSQVINRKQLFTKNKEGVKARSVELATTTEVANYDKDGIITSPVDPASGEPTSIFLTATAFNITSSQAYYQFFQEGFAVTFPGTNNQFEVGSGDLPSPGTTTTYRVDLRDGDTNGPVFASKEVTISGVQSGANNYQVFLTNPSPTITVKIDGELDLSTTGTQIKAFKGTQELTHVQNYSAQQLDNVGDPIGTLGEFSSSIFNLDTYISQPSFPQGNPASVGPLDDWTLPQDNPTATVIYKVDIENGRATYFLSQSIASTKEGDVGPGLVFRGPWTGSIEYIYNKESKRRDSVLYSESGNEPYDTYYATKDSGSSFVTPNDSSPGAGDAQAPTRDDGNGGREVNSDYWISLGQEEFFVAAKLAIFEESFVKNTLNVGTPPTSYAVNPQITIAGGTDEPYIAVGQTGTIGFQEQGIWMGMSNSAGDAGTSILPKMSMKSNTVSGKYKSLEWNGETLTIRGAIRQTAEGEAEGRILAAWSTLPDEFSFIVGDTTSHSGITWECISAHDKGITPTYPAEPGSGGSYTTYWQESNLAAKTLRLSSTGQSFVEAPNGTVSPDYIEFTANKENIGTGTTWSTSPSVTLYPDAATGTAITPNVTEDDTVYLRKADFGTNTAVTVTATAGGKSDEITVVRLTDGSNAITIVLSNESHTLQTSAAGTVDYVGSGTTISVYEGAELLDYVPSGTGNGEWDVSTSTTDIDVGDINQQGSTGDRIAVVDDHENMSANQASITYTISGKKLNGDAFSFTKIQSFSKSIEGESGTSGTGGTSGTAGTSGAQGTPGSPGAGIVYRGVFDGTKAYVHTAERRDVVSDGGSTPTYYLVDNTNKNGLTTWVDPTTPGQTDWEQFGAQFESVATDILLAQEVYVDQTINIGEENASAVIALNADAPNNENPYISIGQGESQGFLADGMYFGFNAGNPVMSMVSGSTFMYYQSGSIEISDASFVGSGSIIEGSEIKVGRNIEQPVTSPYAYNFTVSTEGIVSASRAFISGSVNAADGRIGNWIIDPVDGQGGGVLRDNDSEIVFEPNIPEIQIFDSGNQKVKIGSLPELSSITSLGDVASWSTGPTFTSFDHTTPALSQFGGAYVSNTIYSQTTSTTGIAVGAGSYLIKSGSWKQLTIEDTGDLDYSSPGSNSSPNYTPSYEGQVHGGFTVSYNNQRTRTVSLRLEAVDKDNGDAVLGSYYIGGTSLRGNSPSQVRYVAFDTGIGEESVVGNTKVTLSNGTTKLAKDITIDDKILSWDDNNQKWVSARLSKIKKRTVSEVYKVTVGDKVVEVSDSHGFWLFGNETNSGQVRISSIVEGKTKIWIKDGDSKKEVVVDKVERIEREEEVITFSVPQYVNYLSNDIISHNVFGTGLSWGLDTTDTGYTAPTGNKTIAASNDTEMAITLTSGTSNLGFRYRLVVSSTAAGVANVASDGSITWTNNATQTFFDQTDDGSSDIFFSGTPLNNDDPVVERQNNFVEIQPGGVQVVTSQDIFVKARRRNNLAPSSADDAFVFFAKGGTSDFSSLGANPYLTAITVDGDVIPYNDSGMGPWDLGSTVSRWDNVWTNKLNDKTIQFIFSKSNSGYMRLVDDIVIQWVRFTNKTNQFTGTWPTSFTTVFGAVVSKGNASSTYESATNAATISYTTSNYYIDVNDSSRSGFAIAIGTKT